MQYRLALLVVPGLLAGAVHAEEDRDALLARGERAFQRCFACQSTKPGETGLTGPNLHGLLGRPVAAKQGFDYSRAFRSFAMRERRWTPELLDRFIIDPQAVVPDNAMGFFGLRDAGERKALVAYLDAQR